LSICPIYFLRHLNFRFISYNLLAGILRKTHVPFGSAEVHPHLPANLDLRQENVEAILLLVCLEKKERTVKDKTDIKFCDIMISLKIITFMIIGIEKY